MFLVPDRRSLIDLSEVHQDRFRPNFILQEFIPGGMDACWVFNGYSDRNSECKVEFTGRKLRQLSGLRRFGQAWANARETKRLRG